MSILVCCQCRKELGYTEPLALMAEDISKEVWCFKCIQERDDEISKAVLGKIS